MVMSINHNTAAEYSAREFGLAGESVSEQMSKVISGRRVVKASDDPSALAIEASMIAYTSSMSQAALNARQAVQITEIADTSLKDIRSNISKLEVLAGRSNNAFISDHDRENIDLEFQQVKKEIDRIASSTRYGKKRLLYGNTNENKAYVGSSVDGIKNVSFRDGVIDDFIITADKDGGIRLTSMQDSKKTQVISDFRSGDTVYFDKIGVYVDTDENFKESRIANLNQYLDGKNLDYREGDSSYMKMVGVDKVRINSNVGNKTFMVESDGKRVALTDMMSGDTQEVITDGSEKDIYFDRLKASITLSDDFGNTEMATAKSASKFAKENDVLDMGKSKVKIMHVDDSYDAYDLKYDSKSKVLTVMAVDKNKNHYSNINLGTLNLATDKNVKFEVDGKKHIVTIGKEFNKSESFDYSITKSMDFKNFTKGRSEYSNLSVEHMKFNRFKGDLSHLTGRVFFDNGVSGKRMVLESKTGNHMYSLNKVLMQEGKNQKVEFSTDDSSGLLGGEVKFKVINDKSFGPEKVATAKMFGAKNEIEVYNIYSTNESANNIKEVYIESDTLENGVVANAHFVTTSNKKLEAVIEESSVNINGKMVAGFEVTHKSSDGDISVFIKKDPNAITAQGSLETGSHVSFPVDIREIFEFNKDSKSLDISELIENVQFKSDKSEMYGKIISNSFDKGSINNVQITKVIGDIGSLADKRVSFEIDSNSNNVVAKMGKFVSAAFSTKGPQKGNVLTLSDISNPANSIVIKFDVTKRIQSTNGASVFDMSSSLNKMVSSKDTRELGEFVEISADRYNDYKSLNRAYTTSAKGRDADQMSNKGIAKIYLEDSGRIGNVEAIEYFYDSDSRLLTVADIKENVQSDIRISDSLIKEMDEKGKIEIKTEVGMKKIGIHLDKNFDYKKNIFGQSTDTRIKPRRVGDHLIESSQKITTDAKINNIKITDINGAGIQELYDKNIYIVYNETATDATIQGPSIRFVIGENFQKVSGENGKNGGILASSKEMYAKDLVGNKNVVIGSKSGDIMLNLNMTVSGEIEKITNATGAATPNATFEVSNSDRLFEHLVGFNSNAVAETVQMDAIPGQREPAPTVFVGTLEINSSKLDTLNTYQKNILRDAITNDEISFRRIQQVDDSELPLDATGRPNRSVIGENDLYVNYGGFVGIVKDANIAGKKIVLMKNDITDENHAFELTLYNNGAAFTSNDQIAKYSLKHANESNPLIKDVESKDGDFKKINIISSSGMGMKSFDDTHLYIDGDVSNARFVMMQDRNNRVGSVEYVSINKFDLTDGGSKIATLVNEKTGDVIKMQIEHSGISNKSAQFMSHYNKHGVKEMYGIDISDAMENSISFRRIEDISEDGGMLSNIKLENVRGSMAGIEGFMGIDLSNSSNAKLTIKKIDGDEFVGYVNLSQIGSLDIKLEDSKGNMIHFSGDVMNKFTDTTANVTSSLANLHKSIISTYGTDGEIIGKKIEEIDSGEARFKITVGSESTDIAELTINKVDTIRLNIDDLNVKSVTEALEAQKELRNAMKTINDTRSNIGAYQARLITVYRSADSAVEKVRNAISELVDLDASTGYTRLLNETIRMEGVSQMLSKSFSIPRLLSGLLQSMR